MFRLCRLIATEARAAICCCFFAFPIAGNPSIVLSMCRDYWDGSAISNLPATLRKSILAMHQQWSLVSRSTQKPLFCQEVHACALFLTCTKRSIDYRILGGMYPHIMSQWYLPGICTKIGVPARKYPEIPSSLLLSARSIV